MKDPVRSRARIISVLLHPALIQWLFVVFPIGFPSASVFVIVILSLLISFLPLCLSALYFYFSGVKDIYTIPAQKRMLPFAISLLSLSIAWYVFSEPFPWIAERIQILLIFNIVAAIITPFEKISLHVYALSVMSILWFPYISVGGFVLLIPVIWARITLRAHTIKQLVLGGILGIVLALILYFV